MEPASRTAVAALLQLFSVTALPSTARVIARAATVVMHSLDAQDIEWPNLGALSGIDHFAQAQTWTRQESGENVYDGVPSWARCEINERVSVPGVLSDPRTTATASSHTWQSTKIWMKCTH